MANPLPAKDTHKQPVGQPSTAPVEPPIAPPNNPSVENSINTPNEEQAEPENNARNNDTLAPADVQQSTNEPNAQAKPSLGKIGYKCVYVRRATNSGQQKESTKTKRRAEQKTNQAKRITRQVESSRSLMKELNNQGVWERN
ncbi:hypothetical protein BDV93DRAFT_512062 [Ceratobasidium sp. AG-I]|nr:hypothetical protein BDV93DRAFT_512062 [Ceratobasidium sp. AG-I]